MSDINAMKKTDLVSLVKSLMADPDSDGGIERAAGNSETADGSVMDMLQQILAEVKGLKDERFVIRQELQSLQKNNDFLSSAVMQHQRFLESLDAERRRQNMIVTGISEVNRS